jgi:release factor glutamine methyltransferase
MPPPGTLGDALAWAGARLRAAGIEAPQRDARVLLAASAGISTATVMGWPERVLAPAVFDEFAAMVERRAKREPVSRILGRREFWSLDFAVTPATLDPRADSETVIEAALAQLGDAPVSVLDLGTGTGCLLLALLGQMPFAQGWGIDRSAEAVAVAQRNAAALNLADRARFWVGDWAESVGGGIDLVIANPPYIETGVIATLDPEVRLYDPMLALDGGADGLAAYRAIIGDLPRVLNPSGLVVFEIGAGQAESVAGLMAHAGLTVVEIRPDLAGIPRAIVGRIGGPAK